MSTPQDRADRGDADRAAAAAAAERGGAFATLTEAAYRHVYRRVFAADSGFADRVDTQLSAANRATPVELFLSRAIALGALTGVTTAVLVGVLLAAAQLGGVLDLIALLDPPGNTLPIAAPRAARPVAAALITLVAAVVVATPVAVIAAAALIVPVYTTTSQREREIDKLLPDTIAYMYALSSGGMNQIDVLEAVAEADDVYGAAAEEFQIIIRRTRYFDEDYRSAIRRRAVETPSDTLSQFLTDMLSIISSGGDLTEFLDDKREQHRTQAKQQQEKRLETIELLGEMYLTISILPALLIILVMVMEMTSNPGDMMLLAITYGLTPGLGVLFLVITATAKGDEVGSGTLRGGVGAINPAGYLDRSVTDSYATTAAATEDDAGAGAGDAVAADIFAQVHAWEGWTKANNILRHPAEFFRRTPRYTFVVSVPAAAVLAAFVAGTPTVGASWSAVKASPVPETVAFVYLPLLVTFTPYVVFREWRARRRATLTDDLTDALRKLSSANDTGQTLLEAIDTVGDTTPGLLGRELKEVRDKVRYGTSLPGALTEFNNKYKIPRVARTMKLIIEAQQTSEYISDVLATAARASETQDQLENERKSKTRMQVVVIAVTFLVLLGIFAAMRMQFVGKMGNLIQRAAQNTSGGGAVGFGGFPAELLGTALFHAALLQGVAAGTVAGYLRTGDLKATPKYVLVFTTIVVAAWAYI